MFSVFWRIQGFQVIYLCEEDKSIKLQSWHEVIEGNFWTLNEIAILKHTLLREKALADYQGRYKPEVNRAEVSTYETYGTTVPEL